MSRRGLRKRRLLTLIASVVIAGVLVVLGAIWLAVLVLLIAVWRASRYQGVPVMVYHAVAPNPGWLPWADNTAIRPAVFAAHMAHLAKSGWQVIASRDLIAAQAGAPLPKRAVVLHFDDAYLDFWTQAVPVLRRHNLPATVFASSDFIDPSDRVRDPAGLDDHRGYMNADELRAADANPLFEVACHGRDHARVTTGPATTSRAPEIWGKETAWLWSHMQGNKSRWFAVAPPMLTQVPDNDASLCARIWSPEGLEAPEDRNARVTADLTHARQRLMQVLGRDVRFLCWPFDRCDDTAVANARAAGFTALTGGQADNVPKRGVALISRTHVNDFAAGVPVPHWVEALIFRARLEVAAGNLLFWPVTAVAAVLRKRRFAFLHTPSQTARETEVSH